MKSLLMKQIGHGFLGSHVQVSPIEIDDNDKLHSYYEHLGCDMITVVTIETDGHEYDIIADDEGLLHGDPAPTLYVNDDVVIFGSLCFTKVDEEGDSVALDDEDIARLTNYIKEQEPKMRSWQKEVIRRHSFSMAAQ